MKKDLQTTVNPIQPHKEVFIKKSKDKFGAKFLYNKINYVNYHTKIIITCTVHGDIITTPDAHIKSKYGCSQCAKVVAPIAGPGLKTPTKTTEVFINECKLIHGDKYDYSLTIYKSRISPISIICPLHGEFTLPQAFRHLEGRGCKSCYLDALLLPSKLYVERATERYEGKYSYEKLEYKGRRKSIIVTCPTHGDFIVNAGRHLKGIGCKNCEKQ